MRRAEGARACSRRKYPYRLPRRALPQPKRIWDPRASAGPAQPPCRPLRRHCGRLQKSRAAAARTCLGRLLHRRMGELRCLLHLRLPGRRSRGGRAARSRAHVPVSIGGSRRDRARRSHAARACADWNPPEPSGHARRRRSRARSQRPSVAGLHACRHHSRRRRRLSPSAPRNRADSTPGHLRSSWPPTSRQVRSRALQSWSVLRSRGAAGVQRYLCRRRRQRRHRPLGGVARRPDRARAAHPTARARAGRRPSGGGAHARQRTRSRV